MKNKTKNVIASLKYANVSAQKARLVTRQISGMSIEKALDELTFSTKKASKFVKEVLKSAIANAENNFALDIDELFIDKIYVNEGPTMKRFIANAKGRGNRLCKRSSHITVELAVAS